MLGLINVRRPGKKTMVSGRVLKNDFRAFRLEKIKNVSNRVENSDWTQIVINSFQLHVLSRLNFH